MAADATLAVLAVLGATYIRLGYIVIEPYVALFALTALVTVVSFWWAGMYGIVLHRSDGDVPRIILAVSVATV